MVFMTKGLTFSSMKYYFYQRKLHFFFSRETIAYIPRDKKSPKVEVYASISSMGIAGPVFIDGSVNSQTYIDKVLPIIALEIKNRTKKTDNPTTTRMVPNTRKFVFQQDLATSHTSNVTQKFLCKNIPNFLDKKSTPPAFVEWPIEMFWNEIKTKVYSKKPKTMKELKKTIRQEFSQFDIKWLKSAWDTMPERINAIISAKGGHKILILLFSIT